MREISATRPRSAVTSGLRSGGFAVAPSIQVAPYVLWDAIIPQGLARVQHDAGWHSFEERILPSRFASDPLAFRVVLGDGGRHGPSPPDTGALTKLSSRS